MQVLTVEGVKEAARKFYDAGLLTAQHPEPTRRQCVYVTDDGYRCAVGAALNDESIQGLRDLRVNAGYGVLSVANTGIISIATEDRSPITGIQVLHDSWCKAAGLQNANAIIERERDYFLKAIDHPSVINHGE